MLPLAWDDIDVATPSSNTAAVVTYAAAGTVPQPTVPGVVPPPTGLSHVISGIDWSYSGNPTGGNVQVTDNGDVVFNLDITNGGPGQLIFWPPRQGQPNTAMVITLAAGGGGISGKLWINGHLITANAPLSSNPNASSFNFSLTENSMYVPTLFGTMQA